MITRIEVENGYYTINENLQYHSENDEPAIVVENYFEQVEDSEETKEIDGYKAWYKNGQLHRENNPAVIRNCGKKFWYDMGQFIREEN